MGEAASSSGGGGSGAVDISKGTGSGFVARAVAQKDLAKIKKDGPSGPARYVGTIKTKDGKPVIQDLGNGKISVVTTQGGNIVVNHTQYATIAAKGFAQKGGIGAVSLTSKSGEVVTFGVSNRNSLNMQAGIAKLSPDSRRKLGSAARLNAEQLAGTRTKN
jgi:hypothetical protein